MKFSIVIVAALLACLFFFSAHASAALPEIVSSHDCALIASDECMSERTDETSDETSDETNESNASDSMRFAGTFTNTMVGVSGHISIDLTINTDNTLEGRVDFSQFAGGQFTCGSGEFEGTKSGETIELHFTSDSADPQCGFFQGVSFTIEAALLNNTIISGEYTTDTGQQGVVDLRLISTSSGVFMPLIRS